MPRSARTRRPSTVRTGRAIDLARLGQQHVHPDLFEDGQRRLVDRSRARRPRPARPAAAGCAAASKAAGRCRPPRAPAAGRAARPVRRRSRPSSCAPILVVWSEVLAEAQGVVDRRVDVAARHRIADPEQLVAAVRIGGRAPAAARPAGRPGRPRRGCASRPSARGRARPPAGCRARPRCGRPHAPRAASVYMFLSVADEPVAFAPHALERQVRARSARRPRTAPS